MPNLAKSMVDHFTDSEVLLAIFAIGAVAMWTSWVGFIGIRELRADWTEPRRSGWFWIRAVALFVFVVSSSAFLLIALPLVFVPFQYTSIELSKFGVQVLRRLAPVAGLSAFVVTGIFHKAMLDSAAATARSAVRWTGFGASGRKTDERKTSP